MKKGWGLQNSRSRMIALFIVDMLTVVLDSYLAIILRFKLDNIWVPEEYRTLHDYKCDYDDNYLFTVKSV